ncbi:MAG: ribonuclease H-like domain-containing protein [Lachnospiraceae bacterium]|nr:ribonuclease H-like domain-containing protein [Lachnospiraceae bacterium]
MQIIERSYEGLTCAIPAQLSCDADKALFIDIETTGLKKETTSLYLIGCGYYTDEGFSTKLFFADDECEELDIMLRFLDFAKGFSHLFCFNGFKFDIPYLQYKAAKYDIPDFLVRLTPVDIYRLCKPLRYLLFNDSMRQKAIESFLGIRRDDMYGGGELIEVYKRYTRTRSPRDLELLITHNREDVLGMHLIMPILSYLGLKDAPLEFEGYDINGYKDYNGNSLEELILTYKTSLTLPRPFVAKTDSMYVRYSSDSGKIMIRLPLIEGEMKLFFDNYADYRYIPDEDTIVPKSLAEALPKGSYKKATRETCCQKVTGKFVKQPSAVFEPVLKISYKDKRRYFKFPDSFKKEAAETFGRELINIFFTMKKRSSTL